MARVQDVRQFDPISFNATKNRMKQRGESTFDAALKQRDETGKLHPNVDIVGKKPRGSHNAMVRQEDGTCILTHGISMPMLTIFDGTASTFHWLEDFFKSAERQFKLLDGARSRYNFQLATGVANDVYNTYHNRIPVAQVSQFESDERSAEWVRHLMPASMGNDTTTEDYDIALYYATLIYADMWSFYGLKGYLTVALDEIGRGFVNADSAREHLGISGDFSRIETQDICQQLLEHWHMFILQVPTGYSDMLPRTTSWWTERLGSGRVLKIPNPSLLAEVRSALVYVTEAQNPTIQGLTQFLQAGDTLSIDASDLDQVWRIVHRAEEHFGSQAKLPGYQEIPRPGDIFAHYRHAWPIGHPRASENVTPVEADAL